MASELDLIVSSFLFINHTAYLNLAFASFFLWHSGPCLGFPHVTQLLKASLASACNSRTYSFHLGLILCLTLFSLNDLLLLTGDFTMVSYMIHRSLLCFWFLQLMLPHITASIGRSMSSRLYSVSDLSKCLIFMTGAKKVVR